MTNERVPSEEEAEKELSERAENVSEQDVQKLVSRQQEVERKLRHVPGKLRQMVNQVRLLFEMVRDYWEGNYKQVPWTSIAMAAVSLLYFLTPLDIVPDFLPGVGYVDDAVVIGLAFKALQEDLRDYCSFKEYDPKTYFGNG